MGLVLSLGVLLVGALLVATFVHLVRGRSGVMEYHHLDTPRINETRHGGDGA